MKCNFLSIWIKKTYQNKRVYLFTLIMQREISHKITLGENLNPLRDVLNVPSVDNVVNLRNVFGKVDKLGNLWDRSEADADLARYIPGLTDASIQGHIYSIVGKKAYAAQTYSDLKTLDFTVILAAGTYTNYSSMTLVLPIQIKKSTNAATNIDNDMVTVNIFFARWLKEVDIKRYPDDISITPTNNTVSIADSAQMLKFMPAIALDTIRETLLYDKQKVSLPADTDRRSLNSQVPASSSDKNLGSRITDFHGLLGQKKYYRVPLKFFTDLGLVTLRTTQIQGSRSL